jgi:hypothetical protein
MLYTQQQEEEPDKLKKELLIRAEKYGYTPKGDMVGASNRRQISAIVTKFSKNAQNK